MWLWKRHISPKRRLTFNGSHGVISQKTEKLMTIAVRGERKLRNQELHTCSTNYWSHTIRDNGLEGMKKARGYDECLQNLSLRNQSDHSEHLGLSVDGKTIFKCTLKEVVSYVQLTQGLVQWRILDNTIKHFEIPSNVKGLFTNCATINFS
jgi:hypothetical protein